ncbi:MAG: YdhR family protein [Anaerolineae bacterium]
MAKTILQINYKFNTSRAEHTTLVTPNAEYIAGVSGLVWKVWLMNEAEHEAGGIYLFESREAAQEFVSSPAITSFAAHPSLSAFSVKIFEAVEPLSKITRGPLAAVKAVN